MEETDYNKGNSGLCIISGGQTGADRGALDAAIECVVEHGGWCPRGRKAEDGRIPDRYDLRETDTDRYIRRTEDNIIDSDATVVFTYGEPMGGSKQTILLAEKRGRKCLHIDLAERTEEEAVELLKEWFGQGPLAVREGGGTAVLNVAGSRESNSPGIAEQVKRIITVFLNTANHE